MVSFQNSVEISFSGFCSYCIDFDQLSHYVTSHIFRFWRKLYVGSSFGLSSAICTDVLLILYKAESLGIPSALAHRWNLLIFLLMLWRFLQSCTFYANVCCT